MRRSHLLILLVTLLLSSFVSAQEVRYGTLKSVVGEVVLTQGGAARAAVVGNGIQAADRIVTGRDASTTMTLKDGTIITVGPNSVVELAKIQFDTTTQDGSLAVKLLQGSVRVVTGWLAKLHPDKVQVETPTTVVGVRGTDFIVEVP